MKTVFLFLSLLLTQLAISQTQYDIIFKNASVVTLNGNEVLTGKSIAVLNGKIVAIENTKGSKLRGKKEIDLKSQFVMPSLADAHVHFPDSEQEMEKMLNLYIINGVTKLRSMRGDWKHKEWKTKFNTTTSFYPKLYLSAPPINKKVEMTIPKMEEYVSYAKNNGFQFIKILSIKDDKMFSSLDSLCKKYNMPIAGHYPSTQTGRLAQDLIFKSNFTSMEHLDGLAEETTTLDTRIKAFKQKEMVLCPTLSWYSVGSGRYSYDELRQQPGIEYVSKVTLENWISKTKEYREKIGDAAYKKEVAEELKKLDEKYIIIKKLNEAGVKMILSPDSSSKFMISGFAVEGEMELLQNSKIENVEIVKMATVNFANFFNENYGLIAKGKDADFIIVKENPLINIKTLKNVVGVFYNNVYLSQSDLDAIKSKLIKEVNP